ncbi:hypothetical protein HDK77DRAFT_304938 [Phyllosticta capitalensis]
MAEWAAFVCACAAKGHLLARACMLAWVSLGQLFGLGLFEKGGLRFWCPAVGSLFAGRPLLGCRRRGRSLCFHQKQNAMLRVSGWVAWLPCLPCVRGCVRCGCGDWGWGNWDGKA